MILFLSSSFQTRLALAWKPELTAFLVGDRNHYFFVPDSLVEVQSVSPETIDSFLGARDLNGQSQLLGFLSPDELAPLPGYLFVRSARLADPGRWNAQVYLYGEKTVLEPAPVQIQVAAGR